MRVTVFQDRLLLLRLGKRTRSIGNQRKNRDNPDYSIGKIGKNSQKTPENRSFTVTQIPPPTLAGVKKLEMSKIIIIKLENRNGKKNNSMDISSDKQAKSHMRNLGHG